MKPKRTQVLENKQSHEIADSQPIMISMTYGETREAFRFAWRNERFVLARCWQEAKHHGRSPVQIGASGGGAWAVGSDSGMAPQAIEKTQNGLANGMSSAEVLLVGRSITRIPSHRSRRETFSARSGPGWGPGLRSKTRDAKSCAKAQVSH